MQPDYLDSINVLSHFSLCLEKINLLGSTSKEVVLSSVLEFQQKEIF